MSEMVERLVRVIEAEIFSLEAGSTPKGRLKNAARAAIKEMREPTREMVSAVQDRAECFSFGAELLDSDIRSIFALAIDRALK